MSDTLQILLAIFGGMIVVPAAAWCGVVWLLYGNKV